MCACVRACVRGARVRACVRACVHACVRVCVCVCVLARVCVGVFSIAKFLAAGEACKAQYSRLKKEHFDSSRPV